MRNDPCPNPKHAFYDGRPLFAAKPTEMAESAAEGSYEYRLIESAAPISPSELDGDAEGLAVEVRWGRNALHVAHLRMDEAFYAGDDEALGCDFMVPAVKLGASRAPIALAGAAVLLPGATGTVTQPNGEERRLEEVIAAGATRPCMELAGAQLLPVADGMKVEVRIGDLTFEVRGEKRAKKALGWSLAAIVGGATAYVAGSFVMHAGLLGTLAMLSPPLAASGDDALSDEQRYLVQHYLDSAADKEREALEDLAAAAEAQPSGERAGEGSPGAEGAMGDESAPDRDARFTVKDRGAPPAVASRQALLEDAASLGMIGLLSSLDGAEGGPTSPWGEALASGFDPTDANGHMWGGDIGDAWGPGGLGLSGIGEGGDKKGRGIGLADVGTIGGGWCTGDDCDGFGSSHGRLPTTRRAKAPVMRSSPVAVSGRLPPEVIQRIVRMNYGRYRACYESGLRNNPSLAGNVSVSFVIGRDGTVSSVSGGGSLPDSGVVSCISRAFYGLSFPQPDGGIVTVSYGLSLTPGS